jgi:acyl-CoA thioester hydrolase
MDRQSPPTRADFFDTAIASYLMGEGGLDPWRDPVVGFCVESGCRFRRGIRYPDRVTAGLRVARLGRSSVRYEIGIFRGDELEAAADGHFVHVFVDRARGRSAPIPEPIRAALSRLMASPQPAPP